MKNTIQTLSDQLIAAAAAGNDKEMIRLSKELVTAARPASFSDSWNYGNKTKRSEEGSFSDVWNYAKKG